MSEQKPSHEVKGIVHRAPRQDCVEAQIWGRVHKLSAELNIPKNTVASIILKWKFGTTKPLPRAGRTGEKVLGQGGDRWLLWQSSIVPSRRTTISAALH
jgi:hypothetical protein